MRASLIPEHSEVSRMTDEVREHTQGHLLLSVDIVGGRYLKAPPQGLEGLHLPLRVTSVQNKGKFMYWELGDDNFAWLTMGMSGCWSKGPLDKHDALRFTYENGRTLTFNDQRRFGTIKFVYDRALHTKKIASLGFTFFPEPVSTTALWWFLQKQLKKFGPKPIGQVMMDQTVFCGVGNYLRAEALWAARVSPWKLISELLYSELERISFALHEIITAAYKSNGATIATFKDINGHSGTYASRFAVYGRKTDALGHSVTCEETPDGRTIWWSPNIQI